MSFEVSEDRGFLIVRLDGPLNAITTPAVQPDLEEHLTTPAGRVVLDLSRVPFVSSQGLRLIIQAAKSTKEHGTLIVCGLTEQIRQMFALAGLDRIVEVHDTFDDAVGIDNTTRQT